MNGEARLGLFDSRGLSMHIGFFKFHVILLAQLLVIFSFLCCSWEVIVNFFSNKKTQDSNNSHLWKEWIQIEILGGILFMVVAATFYYFVPDKELLRSSFFDFLWIGWASLGLLSVFFRGIVIIRRIHGVIQKMLTALFLMFSPLFITWALWIFGSKLLILPSGGR